jgi:hypothetical protein
MAARDLSDARSDARDTAEEYLDEIVAQLIEVGDASDQLYDHRRYPNGDNWHHENHVDHFYNLTDAAETIDNLSRYEETDSCLWQGQQPKEAIGTCAAFTYGNAVMAMWSDLIEEINDDEHVIEALTQPEDWVAKDEDDEWTPDEAKVRAAVQDVIDNF